jgi:hypothetical protein
LRSASNDRDAATTFLRAARLKRHGINYMYFTYGLTAELFAIAGEPISPIAPVGSALLLLPSKLK